MNIFVEDSVMDRASITPDEEIDGDAVETTEAKSEQGLDIFGDFVASLEFGEIDDEDDEYDKD